LKSHFLLESALEYYSIYTYKALKRWETILTQRTKPKLSSRGKMLLHRLRSGKATLNDLGSDLTAFEEALLALHVPTRKELLVDLANCQDEGGINWFWRKWGGDFRPETPQDLIELSRDLRRLWAFLTDDEYEPDGSFTLIPNKWLAWRPSPEQLEVYRHWHDDEEVWKLQGLPTKRLEYFPFFASITSGKFIPDPNCLRAMLIQGVFENLRHLGYCANADCVAPYFIAKRADQSVCNAEVCKAEKQREHARKWWNENRANRSRKAKRLKRTKKRGGGNVAHKAR
jgi:hypothetical protein